MAAAMVHQHAAFTVGQPRLADGASGQLMDERFGRGWRLVLARSMPAFAPPLGVTLVALGSAESRELDDVVAAWMARHGCTAALVRPDHCVYGTANDDAGLTALLAEQASALNHPIGDTCATT